MENEVIKRMIKYNGNDVRRINHALKVLSYASYIAVEENVESNILEIIKYAAVLHDIGIHQAEIKYKSASGKYQEIEGPAVAESLIKDLDIAEEIKKRVYYLIGNHHSYQNIDNIDFQILVEADFIVNIFEDNTGINEINAVYRKIFRTSSGKSLMKTLYMAED